MRRIIAFTLLIIGFAVPALGLDSPEAFLKQGVERAIELIENNNSDKEDDRAKLEKELYHLSESIFDFKTLSMGALGIHWRRFSKEQKVEFAHFFSKIIAQSYFDSMKGQSFDNISVIYGKTDMLSPTRSGTLRADIQTKVSHNGVVTPVDYRMLGVPDKGWRVYDVRIEGVSMVANYREQYRKRFKETPDELITELKEKLKK